MYPTVEGQGLNSILLKIEGPRVILTKQKYLKLLDFLGQYIEGVNFHFQRKMFDQKNSSGFC